MRVYIDGGKNVAFLVLLQLFIGYVQAFSEKQNKKKVDSVT